MKQTIRIIGGQYRGKKLTFPAIDGLRPTPDRVRETLFNWLMHDIRNTHCLDAFAGSGALGFEAYSRGASKITFIEQAPKAYHHLQQTITSFNASLLTVVQIDACEYLKKTNEQFDIVFIDPPFMATNQRLECINTLSERCVLKSGGLLYLESPNEIELDILHWKKIKLKHTGQVTYGLYKKR